MISTTCSSSFKSLTIHSPTIFLIPIDVVNVVFLWENLPTPKTIFGHWVEYEILISSFRIKVEMTKLQDVKLEILCLSLSDHMGPPIYVHY